MDCPDCGGRLDVRYSAPMGSNNQYQRRYRRCPSCGSQFESLEELSRRVIPRVSARFEPVDENVAKRMEEICNGTEPPAQIALF